VSHIATHAVPKTPTITKATYKLQTEGFVSIFTSETDARVSIIKLTDSGEEVITKVTKNSQRLFESICTDFSVKQLEILNAKLQSFF
jgi:DNA-binding MarR family transcriptional regulator